MRKGVFSFYTHYQIGGGMNKTVLALLVSVCATVLSAHSEECDYEIQGDLEYDRGDMRFYHDNEKTVLRIDTNNQLYIDGHQQNLSDEQQELVNEYAQAVREMIPLFFGLVVDAGAIGVEVATLAVNTLFEGEDIEGLTDTLAEIKTEFVDQLDPEHFSTRDFDGDELESLIENTVEQAMVVMLPELAAMAVTSVFSSESDPSQFEGRLKKLEHLIETRAQAEFEVLEARFEGLCKRLEKMDGVERRLAEHNLSQFDFIEES